MTMWEMTDGLPLYQRVKAVWLSAKLYYKLNHLVSLLDGLFQKPKG